MAYLYRHIRLDKNIPFYIGIGTRKDYRRAYEKSKRNPFWQKVVAKTAYDVEIVLDNLTWEDACEKEKEFIALYGRKDLGTGTLCNLTDGGDLILGLVRTDEHREKLRIVNLGKKMSVESVQKLKESLKGRTHSASTREKMSKARRGLQLSEVHRLNISKGNTGKKRLPDQILNIRKGKSKNPVLQYDMEGNFIKEWPSKHEVQRVLGIARAGINRCIKQTCKQAGGFVWKLKSIDYDSIK